MLAVFEDAEENVWVGTQGGMLRLQPGAASTVTTVDGAPLSINTIYQDPRGPVLVAALNGRLFQVARQTLVPVAAARRRLAGLPIRNVFRDSKGRLWIGTDGQGVARLDGSEVVRFTMKEGLVNDFVRAFCEDREGGIWIGTDGGLSHWRGGRVPQLHHRRGPGLRQHPRPAAGPRRQPLGRHRRRADAVSGGRVRSPIRCSSRLRGTEGLGAPRGCRAAACGSARRAPGCSC